MRSVLRRFGLLLLLLSFICPIQRANGSEEILGRPRDTVGDFDDFRIGTQTIMQERPHDQPKIPWGANIKTPGDQFYAHPDKRSQSRLNERSAVRTKSRQSQRTPQKHATPKTSQKHAAQIGKSRPPKQANTERVPVQGPKDEPL